MHDDPLDTTFLIENTQTGLLGSRWIFEKSLPSTNDHAKQLAMDGTPEGTVVLSDTQTKGKGRMGRQWDSPSQGGVYLSILLYPPRPLEVASYLTLLAGVAAVNALSTWCEITLKWPNDLIAQDKKLCGILCEFLPECKPMPATVIGIGINVHQTTAEFPEDLRSTATSLFLETGQHLPRTQIVKKLIEKLDREYHDFSSRGPEYLIKRWSDRSCMFGQVVALSKGNSTVKGLVKSLDSNGHLVLETENGEETFAAGEATIEKN